MRLQISTDAPKSKMELLVCRSLVHIYMQGSMIRFQQKFLVKTKEREI